MISYLKALPFKIFNPLSKHTFLQIWNFLFKWLLFWYNHKTKIYPNLLFWASNEVKLISVGFAGTVYLIEQSDFLFRNLYGPLHQPTFIMTKKPEHFKQKKKKIIILPNKVLTIAFGIGWHYNSWWKNYLYISWNQIVTIFCLNFSRTNIKWKPH